MLYLEEIKLFVLVDNRYRLTSTSEVLQGIELNHQDIFE
jgi:hypothetical protein